MSDESKKDESVAEKSDAQPELSDEQLKEAAGGIIDDGKIAETSDSEDSSSIGVDSREPLATTWASRF